MLLSETSATVVACQQAVLRFYYALDRNNYPLAMEQVGPDCIWERGGVLLQGREQIEASVRKKSPTQVARHVVNNFALLRQEATGATAVYCLVLHLYDDGSQPRLPVPGSTPFLMVDVTCELKLEDDRVWRIQQLDVTHTFSYAREVTTPLLAASARK
ncbi:nuclear transport factor 2 family protein [Paraburkholderia sp. J67]|uniref:nuclear transport factor 2 family protein n=1 Tax=Paraburkholderia sp. J67 TaxID=2805435 RepID=UPI002ABE6093|nr:nuclear transport factor 2 family protein [Paraburkholderia sp. J67]